MAPENGGTSTVGRMIVLAVIAAAAAAFFWFDLDRYLSFDFLKQSQERFVALYEAHRLVVILAYMTLYVLVTALSLPGALIMTLAGGAMFGLVVGTMAVSFASTIGATLACFVSRFLLRDWVLRRFGERLETIREGIRREGAFYLFTLRLVPLFPFFVINLLFGLTDMQLSRFFWVSQLGMLPATIVYVNAGSELAGIDSPAGIVSPGLIVSFALLGLFPVVVKRGLAWYRSRATGGRGGTNTGGVPSGCRADDGGTTRESDQ